MAKLKPQKMYRQFLTHLLIDERKYIKSPKSLKIVYALSKIIEKIK